MQPENVEGFRLSPQQRRAWIASAPNCAAGAGTSSFAVALSDEVSDEVLRQALGRVIERHDVLHTRYRRLDGMVLPVQVLDTPPSPEWHEVALDDGGTVEEVLHQEGHRPFDLTAGPTVRVTRVNSPGGERVAVVSVPPLVADARSVDNLILDLEQACRAVAGQGSELDANAVSYVQFSEFQNALFEGDEGAEARGYWEREELLEPSPLTLPFALRAQGGEGASEIGRCSRPLETSLSAAAAASASELDCTQQAWWLAVWQSLLWRLSGANEIVVAQLAVGRPHEIFERAVGLFARWIPVGCDFDHGVSFREIVARVDEAQKRAEAATEGFLWASEAGEAAAFPVVGFAFESAVQPESSWLTLRDRRLLNERSGLKLTCQARDDQWVTELEFETSSFAAEDIERVLDHLHHLATSAVANVDQTMGRLTLLAPAERRRQLVEHNATESPFPPTMGWHRWFESQAEMTPDQAAVICAGRRLSYSELNQRANRVARLLRDHGVGANVPVAVLIERSVDMLVAMLGVLKAGGAFAPLDTTQPSLRLALMLEDLGAPVLLTHGQLQSELPTFDGRIVSLDGDREEIAHHQADNLAGDTAAEDLAYLIFTSGSTGRPKGVMVEHRQVLNYTRAVIERIGFVPGSSFQMVSTFAADLGNTMIFPALSTGGCLHVMRMEEAADAEELASYAEQHPIDYLKIVPSHLEALLDSEQPAGVLPRRCLIFGGEALRPKIAATVFELAPDCAVFNHYGPSETTVGVITHRLADWTRDDRSRSVPLGYPIANTQIHLLDSELEPEPVWVAGELYIGGANLTRGYRGHPSLTSEKFLPNPFSTAPGVRLYRSGDLARRLPGGEVEFLGRVDHQVKFHGFRVELEELREALNRHPEVRDSVVTVKPDKQGRDVLLAFYMSRQEQNAAELRSHLSELILEETIPNIFVHLRRLPLTLNGKINYRALPDVAEAQKLAQRPFVAPRDETETTIAKIWAELLGLERVSIEDNFFELGGHSLLATRAISRQRQAFGVDMALRRLFDHPTVAQQASLAVELRQEPGPASVRTAPEMVHDATSLEDQLDDLEGLGDEEVEALLGGTPEVAPLQS